MLHLRRSLFIALLVVGFTVQALAQPFTIRVQLPDSTTEVADGGTVTIPTNGIGFSNAANISITNRGTATAVFNFIQLTGSADFTMTGVPDTPFTLGPAGVFGVQVTYLATSSARIGGRLTLNFTSGATSSSLNLNLAGVAPEFSYSYTPQGGNATSISTGGSIVFPATAIDATSSVVVVITNRGTVSGTVNAITLTGANFQLVGAPLPGVTVDAGRDLRFTVSFTARQLEAARGTLQVETQDRRVTFALEGSGLGALFAYDVVRDSSAAPLRPNQTITLPDTLVSEKSSIVVRAQNNGNAEGRISVIGVAGAGFSLSETPLLPLTVPAGGGFAFTVNFSPTTPGRAMGRLRIGSDDFDLAGNALGANLLYGFAVGGVSTSVAPNGSVILTPVAVGSSTLVRFTISNTGTAATTITSIGLAAASTVFTLTNVPSLPLSLAAGASASFDVTFAPATVGSATATLRVDSASFTLSATGNNPPPLPAIRFDGAAGAQEPLQQPAVGLLLAAPYALPLNGTLTLTFNSDVAITDPAVQFATGGRTVSFTVPANSTRAIFPNNTNQIRIQTGSVAGTITLTPSVSTEGGINLTPTTPPTHNLSVAQAAPRLLSVAVSARTANTLTLLVSGYATNRSITQMDLTFTPTSGENVGTTRITLPVESAFLGWYQSTPSTQFGSLFTATVPLTFSGDVKNVSNPTDTVQSVSVTLGNRVGTSSAVSLTLR